MGIISLCGAFMALQFEKQPDGYLYRANGKGPALPATRQEFDRFVHKGGISFLLHCAALMLGVIAAAMLTAVWFPKGGEAGGMVLIGILLVAICYALYRSMYWAMLAPQRELAGRTPVAAARIQQPAPPPQPAGSDPAQPPRKAGCLVLLGFALAELIGGIGSGWLAYVVLSGVSENAGMIGALVTGFVVIFLIDRACERRTGESILSGIPFIP